MYNYKKRFNFDNNVYNNIKIDEDILSNSDKSSVDENFIRSFHNNTVCVNGLYKGEIPTVLQNLTFIEISMISIYNPITTVKIEGLN